MCSRALGPRLVQLGVGQVDRDDPAAERGGDLHRRQADAARPVHRDPLAGGQPPWRVTAWKAVMYRQPMAAADSASMLSGSMMQLKSALRMVAYRA